MVRHFVIAAALSLSLVACEKQGSTLASVERDLMSQAGHIPLGDYAGITFEPLYGVDWLLFVPANATPEMFAAAGLADAIDPIPPELLGQSEPIMATIDGGTVKSTELPAAFQAVKVLAKRGKNSHGVKLVRKLGRYRSTEILAID